MTKKPHDDTPSIKLKKDGPFKFKGRLSLVDADGRKISIKKKKSLCRCGASKKMPFCDDSHKRSGFTSEKSSDRVPDRLDTYVGHDITILDNRGACSHIGICTDELPSVWRTGKKPWIDPNGASKDKIVRTIRKCPSGALSYIEEGRTKTKFYDTPEIQVTHNGPFHVRGGIKLKQATFGAGTSREHYDLCSCGHSRNQPFCDGSHRYINAVTQRALLFGGGMKLLLLAVLLGFLFLAIL